MSGRAAHPWLSLPASGWRSAGTARERGGGRGEGRARDVHGSRRTGIKNDAPPPSGDGRVLPVPQRAIPPGGSTGPAGGAPRCDNVPLPPAWDGSGIGAARALRETDVRKGQAERDAAPLWWQSGVIYQVYPRSFQDSDGDGIGDLEASAGGSSTSGGPRRGRALDLPHLSIAHGRLGYDVADYTGIHPLFGTLKDFDRLVADAHGLGLKVILDLVPNHTSGRTPLFREARASRTSPNGTGTSGAIPRRMAGRRTTGFRNSAAAPGPSIRRRGSIITTPSTTGSRTSTGAIRRWPRLSTRHAFWLDRGVDGFRVDVIWHLMKDAAFRDNPPDEDWREGMKPLSAFQARPHHRSRGGTWRHCRSSACDGRLFDDRVLIGEIYLPVERLAAYYGASRDGAHLPFNFALLEAEWKCASARGSHRPL